MAKFFKKRKEAKKQKRDDARARTAAQLAQELAKANYITDPAARILELQEVREGTPSETIRHKREIDKPARDSGGGMVLGATGAGAAAGIPFIVPTAGMSIFLGAIAGTIVGGLGGDKRQRNVIKKFEKEAAAHFAALAMLREQTVQSMDSTIEADLKEISKSPLYEDVLLVPGMADAFSRAAAKRFVADEQAATEEAKAGKTDIAEEKKTEPRPVKKPSSGYDHLRKFGQQ
jgi:hypothetical protein